MRVIRQSDEEYAGMDVHHILTAANHASTAPDDLLTDAERRQLRKERREALARKRPPGFTADWGRHAQ